MTDDLTSQLAQLADVARPVHSIDLTPLSDLTRDELAQFRLTWDGLHTARRQDLLSTMVKQAEADIQMNFHAVLRSCLADKDARVRRLAIEGLWEDERLSLVQPLVDILGTDPAADVRAAAATSLGRFVLLGVLEEIAEAPARLAEQALRMAWDRAGEPVEVRRRALESLSYTDAPGVHDLIRAAYYHDDAPMRQSALFAMGRNADARWNQIVLAEFSSQEPTMRFEAAGAAGEMALRAAVRPLVAALEDPDGQVREAAVYALGKIGGSVAQRALKALLEGEDEALAEAAAEALDELMFDSERLDGFVPGTGDVPEGRRDAAPADEEDWEGDSFKADEDDMDWDDEADEDFDERGMDAPMSDDEEDEIRQEQNRSRWAL